MKLNLQHYPELRFRDLVLKELPADLSSNKTAEGLSLYSATILNESDGKFFFGGLPVDSTRSLAWLLAVYIHLPEEYDYFRALCFNKILSNAQSNNYEGKWLIFKQIYDLDKDETFSFVDIWYEVLEKNFSHDDLFGNLARQVRKYLKLFRSRKNILYYLQIVRPSKKKPVQPCQIGRGYKDKGHAVLYGQRGDGSSFKYSRVTGANPEIEDVVEKFPTSSPSRYMWLKTKR